MTMTLGELAAEVQTYGNRGPGKSFVVDGIVYTPPRKQWSRRPMVQVMDVNYEDWSDAASNIYWDLED